MNSRYISLLCIALISGYSVCMDSETPDSPFDEQPQQQSSPLSDAFIEETMMDFDSIRFDKIIHIPSNTPEDELPKKIAERIKILSHPKIQEYLRERAKSAQDYATQLYNKADPEKYADNPLKQKYAEIVRNILQPIVVSDPGLAESTILNTDQLKELAGDDSSSSDDVIDDVMEQLLNEGAPAQEHTQTPSTEEIQEALNALALLKSRAKETSNESFSDEDEKYFDDQDFEDEKGDDNDGKEENNGPSLRLENFEEEAEAAEEDDGTPLPHLEKDEEDQQSFGKENYSAQPTKLKPSEEVWEIIKDMGLASVSFAVPDLSTPDLKEHLQQEIAQKYSLQELEQEASQLVASSKELSILQGAIDILQGANAILQDASQVDTEKPLSEQTNNDAPSSSAKSSYTKPSERVLDILNDLVSTCGSVSAQDLSNPQIKEPIQKLLAKDYSLQELEQDVNEVDNMYTRSIIQGAIAILQNASQADTADQTKDDASFSDNSDEEDEVPLTRTANRDSHAVSDHDHDITSVIHLALEESLKNLGMNWSDKPLKDFFVDPKIQDAISQNLAKGFTATQLQEEMQRVARNEKGIFKEEKMQIVQEALRLLEEQGNALNDATNQAAHSQDNVINEDEKQDSGTSDSFDTASEVKDDTHTASDSDKAQPSESSASSTTDDAHLSDQKEDASLSEHGAVSHDDSESEEEYYSAEEDTREKEIQDPAIRECIKRTSTTIAAAIQEKSQENVEDKVAFARTKEAIIIALAQDCNYEQLQEIKGHLNLILLNKVNRELTRSNVNAQISYIYAQLIKPNVMQDIIDAVECAIKQKSAESKKETHKKEQPPKNKDSKKPDTPPASTMTFARKLGITASIVGAGALAYYVYTEYMNQPEEQTTSAA